MNKRHFLGTTFKDALSLLHYITKQIFIIIYSGRRGGEGGDWGRMAGRVSGWWFGWGRGHEGVGGALVVTGLITAPSLSR